MGGSQTGHTCSGPLPVSRRTLDHALRFPGWCFLICKVREFDICTNCVFFSIFYVPGVKIIILVIKSKVCASPNDLDLEISDKEE